MKGNMKKILILAAVSVGLVLLTVSRSASEEVVITVPGTACVFFAGQTLDFLQTEYPPGSTGDHATFHTDTSDAAMMPPFIDVCAGRTLSISAEGSWGYGGAEHGPDGAPWYTQDFWSHQEYDDLGISRVQGRPGNLVGVFLTDLPPSLPAPTALNYWEDMTTPELQQLFIIGASLEDIAIPEGATRLFLGYFDGFGWYNNSGSVEVTATLDCISAVINIKPGSYPNSINTCSGGTTPVIIFGSETFNVRTIDQDQLIFASAGVKTVGKSGRFLCSIADVGSPDHTMFDSLNPDPDGYEDLICHFITMEMTSLADTSTTADITITGCTDPSNGCNQGDDGYYVITATDSVRIVKDD